MNSEDLLHAQRRLRGSLLDTRQSAVQTPPGATDLAAHLLLYLDDADRCWQLILQWMRGTLDADRVDGGYASPLLVYRPSGESVREGLPPPLPADLAFAPAEPSLRTVWSSAGVVVFGDVAQDARFAPGTREQLLAMGTRAKLAIALRDGDTPVGLMCCNWNNERRRWKPDLSRQVGELAGLFLSPILAAAASLRGNEDEEGAPAAGADSHADLLARLTPGELAVAQLVVTGMSYKEIAARLNRSFSTVDHRLRTIREKSGARSTARMVAILSSLLAGQKLQ